MEDRFDYVFSYWLFAWWIFYALRWTRHSPALWLFAAVFFELGLFFILFFYRYPAWYLGLFVAINLVIKGWPLWTMRREPWRDFWPGLVLYLTYLVWLRVNGETGTKIVERAWTEIKKTKPFSVGINHLLRRLSPRLLF